MTDVFKIFYLSVSGLGGRSDFICQIFQWGPFTDCPSVTKSLAETLYSNTHFQQLLRQTAWIISNCVLRFGLMNLVLLYFLLSATWKKCQWSKEIQQLNGFTGLTWTIMLVLATGTLYQSLLFPSMPNVRQERDNFLF